ncbi:hypothetical protein B9479_000822 [Cryptococcus floricola]|uniref:Uncharacterized protein n=1 Tax=Cryptococcus floricola TaxID=2591691 RepID=A0A5D3B7N6_9TREE|nr:hypothetical protein B9479_000822 [Cryptococcus floricola]
MEHMELHRPEDPPPLAAPVPTNAAPSGAPQFPPYHQQQVPASSKPSTSFYALPPESQPLLNKRKSDDALAFGSYSPDSSEAIKANRPLTVEEYFARGLVSLTTPEAGQSLFGCYACSFTSKGMTVKFLGPADPHERSAQHQAALWYWHRAEGHKVLADLKAAECSDAFVRGYGEWDDTARSHLRFLLYSGDALSQFAGLIQRYELGFHQYYCASCRCWPRSAFAVREGNLLGLLPALVSHMVTEAHTLSASAHRTSQNQLIEATHKRMARNRKTMGVPTQQMAVDISAISEPQTPSRTPEWTTIHDWSVSLSRTTSSSVASQDGLGVSTTSGASGVLAPARERSLVVQRSTRANSPSNPVPAKHAAPPSTSPASTRTATADKAPSMSMAARIKEINRLGDEMMQQYERMMKGK